MKYLSDFLLDLHKLKCKYFEKYGSEPNAVLINEKDLEKLGIASIFSILLKEEENLKLVKENDICGLKIIPIRYGKMEVVELLEENAK